MLSNRIHVKLIFLLLTIGASFVIFLVIQNNSEIDKLQNYSINFQKEKSSWFDEVLKLKSENMESFAFDYTYWDEMISFLKSKDSEWAYENIIPSLTKFNIQYSWIYDRSFSPVFIYNSPKSPSINFYPILNNKFKGELSNISFSHFFISQNENLIEVFGAPVQPTSDFKRLTEPRGYFFIGRAWDRQYINSLEILTNSKISIIENHENNNTPPSKSDTIVIYKTLKSYDGNNLRTISFSIRPETLLYYREKAEAQLIYSILFVVVIFTVLSLFLFYSLVKPLKILSRSVITEDFSILEKVKKSSAEFEQFAELITGYYEQRNILIDEISQKNTFENELKINEVKYRSLFENMVSSLILCKTEFNNTGQYIDSVIIEVNSAFEKLLDISKKEIIGKTFTHLGYIPEAERLMKYVEVARTGKAFTFEQYLDRFKKHFHITVFSPAEETFALILEDITERKLAEIELHVKKEELENALSELKETQKQLLQNERLKSLGQMASGIAHDINNSLAPILGYADLLLNNKSNEKISKQLGMIKTASLDIKRTIEHLREFYRAKDYDELLDYIDVNKLVQSALDLTRHRWKNIPESEGKSIRIKTDMQRHLPFIKGNESQLRESLINLIMNSSDAMNNEGTLIFRTYESNNKIVIEIIDNGSGMDEITKQHCLDPFYSTKGSKGTGLGLSMVYGIVKRHDGEIQIESEKNHGTTIRLLFNYEVDSVINVSSQSSIKSKQLNILCIDDDENVLEILKNILLDLDHKVTISRTGNEAISFFMGSLSNSQPFDVVITDLGMPDMDGSQLAKTIKLIDPEKPVILLTGWGSFIESEKMPEVDCILSKPITVEDISISLSNIFDKTS